MTQAQFADKLKVTVAHIRQIENGKRECSVRLLRALSKALAVDMELLLPCKEVV